MHMNQKRREQCLLGPKFSGNELTPSASKHDVNTFQGRIGAGSCACCHTETENLEQICCLIQSHYADSEPASPSTDLMMPAASRIANRVPTFLKLFVRGFLRVLRFSPLLRRLIVSADNVNNAI